MNRTNTPNISETGHHLAAKLAQDGNNYTAFSAYWYEAGNASTPMNPAVAAELFVGTIEFTVTNVEDGVAPYNFELAQNYPNPFNPSTTIKYTLSEGTNVSLKVFDMLGREVATLVNKHQNAGSHSVNFDASNLASGLYVYTINAGSFTSSKKMMLMK
jgi:hypothetical protein